MRVRKKSPRMKPPEKNAWRRILRSEILNLKERYLLKAKFKNLKLIKHTNNRSNIT